MGSSMKRKVGLFLLTVLVAVSLGATIVASLAMYRLVSRLQDEELRRIEASLSERFDVFETMLRSENERNTAVMAKVLPQIEAQVERMGRSPADLTVDELNALSARYGVAHLYFIDRDHKIFNTNLSYDMGLVFPKGPFTNFLDSVFDKGRAMSDGIDLSSVTGTLRTYTYYGPPGKDYLIEASTEVRATLKQSDYSWMSQYFFDDYFSDAVKSNAYVTDVDIYLINASGTWSLIRPGEKLDPALAREILREGRLEVPDASGHGVTTYSRYNRADTIKDERPMMIVRKVTYDLALARQAVVHVFVSSMVMLALMLPAIFWIASRLLQRQIIDPLLNLRGEAGAIAGGDLEHAIANTDRSDEIGHLARSFASMRDSVRSRINDLRETNLAIERFVPQAFLAKIGKPNIVSVALGDNKREHMTIMFSDIRNFTALSETMTPDENFAFINAYLEHVGPVIRDHGGFIDKYIGDAIMALLAQRMAAAEQLQSQANAATDPARKASLEKSLTTLVDMLEKMAPDVEREKQDAVDAKGFLEMLESAYQDAGGKLKAARSELERAQRDMARAAQQKQTAEQQAEAARRAAGLVQTTSSLTVALKTMQDVAAKDLASADAAMAKARLLKPSKPEQDDANIAEALAAASGKPPAPTSLTDRLAALKAKQG